MLLLTVFTFHTHLIRSLLKSLFLGPDGRVYVIQFTSIRNAIGRERVVGAARTYVPCHC